MGKSRAKRHWAGRTQPTGLPSVRDFEEQNECESSSTKTVSNTVVNLIEALQSPVAEERQCACTTIALLVKQPESIGQLLQANLIRIIGPLLVDTSPDVRHAAAGALRNLSVDGGELVCRKMVKEDMMTSLVALLHQYDPPQACAQADKMNQATDTVYHAIYLLLNLCESSDVALKIFNQDNLASMLVSCLANHAQCRSVALAAGECLFTVTEDNAAATGQLDQGQVCTVLATIVTSQHTCIEELLLRTLATGILLNLSDYQPTTQCGATLGIMMIVLSDVLTHDPSELVKQSLQLMLSLSEKTEAVNDNVHSGKGVPRGSNQVRQTRNVDMESGTDTSIVPHLTSKELELKLSEADQLLVAQRLAMELVANLVCGQQDPHEASFLCRLLTMLVGLGTHDQSKGCIPANIASHDDEEMWEDCDWSDTSSDDHSDGLSDNVGASAVDPQMPVSSEVIQALQNTGLLAQILLKVQCPDAMMVQHLQASPQCSKLESGVQAVQTTALWCTSNLMSSVQLVESLGGLAMLQDLWTLLSQLAAAQPQGSGNGDQLEAVTGAMRATVQQLAHFKSPKLLSTTQEDVKYLYKLTYQCPLVEVRINTLRIISVIMCHLVNTLGTNFPQDLLKSVGELLYSAVSEDSELCVVAEALDALMDVFAEDSTDLVLKELALVSKLQALVSQLNTKIHEQRSQLGQHLPVVSTAKTNLVRFIRYKSKRGTT